MDGACNVYLQRITITTSNSLNSHSATLKRLVLSNAEATLSAPVPQPSPKAVEECIVTKESNNHIYMQMAIHCCALCVTL